MTAAPEAQGPAAGTADGSRGATSVRVAGLVGAVVLLQAFACWPMPWEGLPRVAAFALPSADLAFLLGVAVVGGLLGWRRCAAHLAALLFLLTALYRAGVSAVLVYCEREFTLFELGMLPGLRHLLLNQYSPVQQDLIQIGAGVALLVVHLGLAWTFARIARTATSRSIAVGLLVGLQVLVLFGWAAKSRLPGSETWRASQLAGLAERGYIDLRAWLGREAVDDRIRSEIAAAAAALEEESRGLDRLAGADVHVLFIESYGHVLWRHREQAAAMLAFWREIVPRLERSGFTAATTWCYPEVIGGASWLAHGQLFTGVKVKAQRTWDLLLQSSLRPLPARLRDSGYQTIEVLPAVDTASSPQMQAYSRYYGFDVSITQHELGYHGTIYPFSRVPDQYALHHLLQKCVRPATRPVFAAFMSASSHAPWQSIPPYVDDWASIGPTTFAGPPAAEYPLTWGNMTYAPEAFPAYGDSIRYSLRVVLGFLEQLQALQRPALVLVLGDHQPPIRPTDPPDGTRHVPFHAFANRPELLEPFRRMGWRPGIEPGPDSESFGTDRFAVDFLRAFRK